MENDIKFLRLVTGEDIISKIQYIDAEGKTLMLDKPMKVIYAYNEKFGAMAINLMTWIFPQLISEESSMSIRATDVLVTANVSDHMKKYYTALLEKPDKEPSKEEQEELIQSLRDSSDVDGVDELTEDELDEVEEAMQNILKQGVKKRVLH